MGNKLLIALISATILFASSNYPDIDRLIEKVKTKRKGLDKEQIAQLKNPFIDEEKLKKVIIKQKIIKELKKRKDVRLRLQSIFDSRAKINGRWYKLGSRVGGYRLSAIKPQKGYVVLTSSKKSLRLFLKRRFKRIKLISKPIGSR